MRPTDSSRAKQKDKKKAGSEFSPLKASTSSKGLQSTISGKASLKDKSAKDKSVQIPKLDLSEHL